MAAHGEKRQRTNTIGDAAHLPNSSTISNDGAFTSSADLHTAINELDEASLKTVFLRAATEVPDVSWMVAQAYLAKRREVENRVINFDSYSKRIWHAINKKYRSVSGSGEYNLSFDVADQVEQGIKAIAAEAGKRFASYGTRKSGLETLRKIGKTICLSNNSVIGHEVQKHFSWNPSMEKGMLAILEAMTVVERDQMYRENDGRSAFINKMEQLLELSRDYGVFPEFDHVVEVLANEHLESDATDAIYTEDEDEEESEVEDDDSDETENRRRSIHQPTRRSIP